MAAQQWSEVYATGVTPPEATEGLPDFPYTSKTAQVQWDAHNATQPLTMAYVDEAPSRPPACGEPATIVLLHGEPSWSYLYRFMIPELVAAGHRVIAPDLIGFGRSEKLLDRNQYSYARHVGWVGDLLFRHLGLGRSPASAITLFVQDWGSLIGLRLVSHMPWAFARVVVGNGFLPTGEGKPSPTFKRWLEFSQTVPELPVGSIIASATGRALEEEEVAAYDAPFPQEALKEGARIFPALVPVTPTSPGAAENVAAWATLSRFQRPFVTAFSDGDPITKGADAVLRRRVAGTVGQAHETLRGGHFLQEDCPEDLVRIILRTIACSPRAAHEEALARVGGAPPSTAGAVDKAGVIAAAQEGKL